ncbi:MAG TPA: NAD(P)H-binding protein [Candidatus Dormibacteraeota bacterium]|jgi:NADH dehydrogenase|nr:NAD(P)H-binding protein [Candidatus Dormibacteraeota bacterium]
MILVTGAGGFVGRNLVTRLAGEGVRGLVRDRAASAPVDGVELVEGDVTRPETLGPVLEGVEVVVHCAAITGDRRQPYRGAYDAVNRVGTANVVRAAESVGAQRIVLLSGLGTRPGRRRSYMATRWGMEEAVRASPLSYAILRPSVLFGRGAPLIRALAGLVRSAPVVPVLAPRCRLQPLWVEDLVSCLALAAREDRWDGRAIALGGGEQLDMSVLMRAIVEGLGVRRALVPMPPALAAVPARAMTLALSRPPLTPAALELLSFDNVAEPDVCRSEFGVDAAGFRDHVQRCGLEL